MRDKLSVWDKIQIFLLICLYLIIGIGVISKVSEFKQIERQAVQTIKSEVVEAVDTVVDEIVEPEPTITPEVSDREKRLVNAEADGTDYDGFMRANKDTVYLYDEKDGEVIGELSKGDYVYVHLMYEDEYVYSGQLQGYLKAEDLCELGSYQEAPIEFTTSLVTYTSGYEEAEEYLLSMPSVGIEADCTYVVNIQENTDKYDIVHAKGLSFIRLSGHNTRSLKDLHKVQVGDEFTYNGVAYIVTFSGTGRVTDDWENVTCAETGDLLLCSSDIELITCHNTKENSMNRWVVLGREK